jgi:hypothetical protein
MLSESGSRLLMSGCWVALYSRPTPSRKKPIQNKVNSTLSRRTALSSFHSFATKIVLMGQSKR